MKTDVKRMDSFQDALLDQLLRMAFEYGEEKEIEAIISEEARSLTQDEETRAKKAYQTARERIEADEAVRKRDKRRKNVKRVLPRIIQVAACIVLILGITAPIAIANVPALRAKVVQMLISIDSEHGQADLRFITEPEFHYPTQWRGSFFPSVIPEGFQLQSVDSLPNFFEAIYTNEAGAELYFAEMTADAEITAGTGDGILTYDEVNGNRAFITQSTTTSYVRIIWSGQDRWFLLDSTALSVDELLTIARSVKKTVQ